MLARQPQGFRNTARAAFSLLELLMVLGIIGIIAAIAGPRYAGALARFRADAAAWRLAADMGRCRDQAMASSRTQRIDFTAHGYVVPTMDDPDRPGQPYAVRLAGAPFHAEIVQADVGGDMALEFNPYGAPDSGGVLVLRTQGGRSRTVVIDPWTGAVTTP
jgi:prepilin-type N-terminal cleavage/methylation domain-containing protein